MAQGLPMAHAQQRPDRNHHLRGHWNLCRSHSWFRSFDTWTMSKREVRVLGGIRRSDFTTDALQPPLTSTRVMHSHNPPSLHQLNYYSHLCHHRIYIPIRFLDDAYFGFCQILSANAIGIKLPPYVGVGRNLLYKFGDEMKGTLIIMCFWTLKLYL